MPTSTIGSRKADHGGKTEPVYTELDRWVLSELHTLVRNVTYALETYDVTGRYPANPGFR